MIASKRSWRAVLFGMKIASRIFAAVSVSTVAARAGSICSVTATRLGLPLTATSFRMVSTIFLISTCARSIAAIITLSGRPFAPPSTIMTASAVPATTRLRSHSSSALKTGLITNSPFSRPTRTAPTGPLKGMLEIASAAEDAMMPITSAVPDWSAEITVAITWVS